MLGAYLAVMVSIATVYLGMQATQVLFLMTGWAEGLLLLNRDDEESESGVTPVVSQTLRFKRVMY